MLQQFKVSLKSLKHLADTCGTTTFAVVNAKRELMNYHQQLFKKRRPPPGRISGKVSQFGTSAFENQLGLSQPGTAVFKIKWGCPDPGQSF